MLGINEVTIVGRLGSDPERRGDSGPVKLSVATERRVKDGDDWKSVTDWHSITVWGRDGENAEKYLAKGSAVAIKGRLETRKFEDREGKSKSVVEIVAVQVIFLDPPGGAGATRGGRDDRGRDDRGRDDRGRDDRSRDDDRRPSRGRDDDRGRDDRGRDRDDRGPARGSSRDDRGPVRGGAAAGRGRAPAEPPVEETFDSDVPF